MKRVQGLDLMRFFAIMLVVALHGVETLGLSHPWLYHFFYRGWVGVDCFFVLSGYLIGGQVFKQRASHLSPFKEIQIFWIRRWWRTLPLYFAALFVYAVVKPLLGFPFKDFNWTFFFFLQNFSRFYDFLQSWSLCIEEHFYIVFPILVYFFKAHRKSHWVWLSFVGLSLFFRFLKWQSGTLEMTDPGIDFSVRFVTHYHLDGIAMGVFLAGTKHSWQKVSRPLRLLGGLLGLFLAFYLPLQFPYYLPGTSVIWMFTALAVGFSLILIAIHDISIPSLFYRPIHQIALWSYGIYIWNSLVIRVFAKWSPSYGENLNMLLFFLFSIVVAIPTYYWIEKPFLKVRDHILKSV